MPDKAPKHNCQKLFMDSTAKYHYNKCIILMEAFSLNRQTLIRVTAALVLIAGILIALMLRLYTAARTAAVVLLGYGIACLSARQREAARPGVHRSAWKRAQTVSSELTFCDVAANEGAMNRLRELADYLAHPEKYAALGAHLPRGVLLYGPPGTGKTLMARALAGEAHVPFFSLCGSDFVEMYVGVGASRVRELFAKAARAGRCVIFIDEIDAIGKRRDDGAGSDERDRTLNALLSEMSGFAPNSGIIVLAATNRADILDPALTRPGRFDAHIEVGLPNRAQRLDILRLHCRAKPLSENVDLERLAADTVRFSGASLESLVNTAAIRAARRGSSVITWDDLHGAFVASVAGEDGRITATREELSVIALHEAGHAVASHLLEPRHRIERISILPAANGAAGYNLTIPEEQVLPTRESLCAHIQVLLAGRAAEELLGESDALTAGAAADLAQAAELASSMVLDLGLIGHPAVSLRTLCKSTGTSCGESSALITRLLGDCYQAVRTLLSDYSALLTALTQTLLDCESLSGTAIDDFFASHENAV